VLRLPLQKAYTTHTTGTNHENDYTFVVLYNSFAQSRKLFLATIQNVQLGALAAALAAKSVWLEKSGTPSQTLEVAE
jgi:hypothetical protein